MIFVNVTDYTSPVQGIGPSVQKPKTLWVGVHGSGVATIEIEGEDGVFRAYPESTFEAPTAQLITVKRARWRLVTTGGPLTVEVQNQ